MTQNHMEVYLDNNATTPLRSEVKEAIASVFDVYGNPSSHHHFGKKASEAIAVARSNVARLIGASSEEVYFTSGGSESNNIVLKGVGCSCPASVKAGCRVGPGPKGHIVTTRIEHPSVLATCRCLMVEGYDVTFLDVDSDGRVTPGQVADAIRDDTVLVTVMYANNEIGTIEPIPEIAAAVKGRGVLFHTDAVQAVGKIPIDVRAMGIDFLSLSGHKLNAPKGIGALYIQKSIQVCPLITGGHQERGMRAGTENLLGIVGIGRAAELVLAEMEAESTRLAAMRDRLEKAILARVPDVKVNGCIDHRLPNTTNISFRFIEGEAILYRLDYEGIAVSTGSACSSGSLSPSHVLLALGLTHEYAHGSIRISLGHDTTDGDIDYVIAKVPEVVSSLRALSPFGPESLPIDGHAH